MLKSSFYLTSTTAIKYQVPNLGLLNHLHFSLMKNLYIFFNCIQFFISILEELC